MANATVNRQVNVYINSGDAQKAYDLLIKREKLLNDELAKTSDPKRMKALNAELAKLKDPIDRAHKKLKGELLPTIRELEIATRKWMNEAIKTGSPESIANFQKFRAELKKAKDDLYGLENAQKGLTSKGIFSGAFWGSFLAGGVTAAISGIGNFFRGAVQEALDADAATKRLESTLDNLGRGDAFDRITRKADDMASKFRYLDNDDIVSVFNRLIDYGKLTEKEMNNLIQVIVDFSAKSKTSLDDSASVIIKALEGNGKALKEYGINLKDTGTETDRLNVIMTTLKEKVDGSAEAFANSAAGGLQTARQEFANLKEEIGNKLIPVLNGLLSWVNNAITGLGYLAGEIGTVFSDVGAYFESGRSGVAENKADRKKAKQAAIDKAVSLNISNDMDPEEIQKLIDARYKQIQTLQELVVRGGMDAAAASEQVQELRHHIEVLSKAQDGAIKKQERLGLGGFDAPDMGKDKSKELQEQRKREEQSYKEFLEKMKDLNADFDAANLEGFHKDLAMLQQKIINLKEEAAKHKDNKEALLQIDELYHKEALALIDKYEKLDKEKFDKAVKAKAEGTAKMMRNYAEALKAGFAIINEDRLAAQDLAIQEARGKKKLDLQMKALKAAEEEEIKLAKNRAKDAGVSEEQIQNIIAGIRAKYRSKEEELELSHFQKVVAEISSYANQALAIFTLFGQLQTDKENLELDRDRRLNDRKKSNLDKRLKAGLITEQQYRREVDRLDREREQKEKEVRLKQFQRTKRERLAQAIMNTAEAVTEALPNIFMALLVGALGAAEIATIAAQKPPQYAKGGKLGGRSHTNGGNAVVDGSGRKIAEIEAGEGIVNKRTMSDRSRYSVSGTPGQIISRLNSMHGVGWEGGATLVPGWRSYSPSRMNYTAMKGVYASGGVFNETTAKTPSQDAIFENLAAVVSNMQATLQLLQINGIPAYTVLTQHEKQVDRLAAIRDDATMKG